MYSQSLQRRLQSHFLDFWRNFNEIFRIPTSAFEKMLTMTASSTVQLNELLEFLHDLFSYIEVSRLKELLLKNKIKLVVILYKFLDNTTKIEIRKMTFYFLLKILDSFDDIQSADKEYIALFNYALDHPLLRENYQKPSYHLQYGSSNLQHTNMSKTYNEYQNYFSSFQELNKVITENSSVVKSEKGFEVRRILYYVNSNLFNRRFSTLL